MTRYQHPRWECYGAETLNPTCPRTPCPGHPTTKKIRTTAKVLAWADGIDNLYDKPRGQIEDYLSAAAVALAAVNGA